MSRKDSFSGNSMGKSLLEYVGRCVEIRKLAISARKTNEQIFLNALSNVGNHETYAEGLKRTRDEIDI